MAKITKIIGLSLTVLLYSFNNWAQETRRDKLYTVSAIGTSIPLGETADFLNPKICTTLGINLGLGNGGLFLFPKLNLHAFSYNGLQPEEGYSYTARSARSSTYLLNVGLGYRKMLDKVSFYGFAGAGGGFVLIPSVAVDNMSSQVQVKNITHGMGIAEVGAGIEFNMGQIALFTEVSYMNGFSKLQDRNFRSMPLTVGIKPNLSKIFNRK